MQVQDPIDIQFDASPGCIKDILALQQKNLRKNLTEQEIITNGFVFVEHDPKTLQAMADATPHVVAYDGPILAGYVLCMSKDFGSKVPELVEYFQKLNRLEFEGQLLGDIPFITCGQTCVAKEYRGQKLLQRMYTKMKELNHTYRFCITEISEHNTRSLHVHQSIGFQPIHRFIGHDGEPWVIVLWDWKK